MLVLDECHHTNGDHPYSILMRAYRDEQGKRQKCNDASLMPQVFGMTASLTIGGPPAGVNSTCSSRRLPFAMQTLPLRYIVFAR